MPFWLLVKPFLRLAPLEEAVRRERQDTSITVLFPTA